MAEEVNLIVNVEAGDGKKTVADVRKELEEAKKSAETTGKALNDGLAAAETKTVSLKAQLKAMKNELLTLDEGSKEFKKLARDAAELEDKIGDVNARVKALSSDTKRLDALVGIGGGIAAGFQAAQGAMALFGTDSKKVEESIKNIIAVQGILNGLQSISNILQKDHIVGVYARIAIEKTAAAFTTAWAAAQRLLNLAMMANPIGLIIAGVAALSAGVVILIKNFEKVAGFLLSLIGLGGTLETQEQANSKKREERTKQETAAHKERLKQINEEKTARITAADNTLAALKLEQNTLDANGKSSADVTVKILEAEAEKTKAVLDANTKKLQSWITYYSNLALINGQSEAEFKESMKRQGIDLEALHKRANDLIAENERSVQYSENAITKFKREQLEERQADSQKAFEESEKERLAEIERLKKEAEAQLEFDEMMRQRTLDADKAFNEKLAEEKKLRAEEATSIRQEESENAIKIALKQQEEEQAIHDAKMQIAQNFAKASADLAETVFALTNALGKQDEESKLKRAKRQFEINKALAIADATISTINGVVNALTEKSLLPAPISTILRASNAVAVAAAGAANIAKIASQKFGGGPQGAVSTVGGGDVGSAIQQTGNSEPKVSPVQAGSTYLNNEPQKVYVVESDITKTQKMVKAGLQEVTYG